MENKFPKTNVIQPIIYTANGMIVSWYMADYIELTHKQQKKIIEEEEIAKQLYRMFPSAKLIREENGAPKLLNCKYPEISISHNKGWFALYFSTVSAGVDIQTFHSKIKQGTDYFMTEEEQKQFQGNDLYLYLIWAAKEAFFKQNKGKIVDVKNDVNLIEINTVNHSMTLIFNKIQYSLMYSVNDNFVLVWT